MPGFRRVGEEELLRAWIFAVDRLHLVGPSGTAFERVVLRHPGAVAVVPLHDDGTVTLVRQYRPAVDAMVLELPAGTLDQPGEPEEEAATRELAEEVGLAAARLEVLVEAWNSPGVSDQRTVLYLATGLTPCAGDRHGVEEESMTIETVHLDEIGALVADGTLRDETTLVGLLLVLRRAPHLARRGRAQ